MSKSAGKCVWELQIYQLCETSECPGVERGNGVVIDVFVTAIGGGVADNAQQMLCQYRDFSDMRSENASCWMDVMRLERKLLGQCGRILGRCAVGRQLYQIFEANEGAAL